MENNIKISKKYKCKQQRRTGPKLYIIAIMLGVIGGSWIGSKSSSHDTPQSIADNEPKVEHLLEVNTTPVPITVAVAPIHTISKIQDPVPQRKPVIAPIAQEAPVNLAKANAYDQVVESIVSNSKDTIQNVIARSKQRHQIECVAKNIYYESRNQPYSGQVAVAMVTMNRAQLKNLPPCKVVYEKNERGCQFTWTCTRTTNETTAINREGWRQSLVIAYITYNRLVTDLTGGALWYFNPKVAHPNWLRGKEPCNNQYIMNGYLGDHRFYRPDLQNATRVAFNY